MAKRSISHVGSEAGIASDLIGGVDFQRIKITLGAEGVDNGDLSASNALPVSGTVSVTGVATETTLAALNTKVTACNTGAVVITSGTITSITNAVAVTGTFWQATQPISGTVTANAGSGTQAVSLATLPALVAGSAAIGKLAANSGVDIGDVDVLSMPAVVLAAGSAAIGTTTDGGSGKTLKSAAFSLSVTGTVVSAVASKRLKVYAVKLFVSTALTINFRDGASTNLEGGQLVPTGFVETVKPPEFLFATTAGNSLDLVIVGVGTAAGRVSYWDSDAT